MEKEQMVEIIPPKPVTTKITIGGITSLIVNRRTVEKISGKAKPEKDENILFKDSLYPKNSGNHTFPSIAIKRAAIDAAHTFATSIPKTRARGAFDISEDWVNLEGDNPIKREDIGCNPNKKGVAIKIIRAEFRNWQATFPITYDANGPLTFSQIVNLINIAGYYVGIGCWRPAKNGIHGRFRVINNEK